MSTHVGYIIVAVASLILLLLVYITSTIKMGRDTEFRELRVSCSNAILLSDIHCPRGHCPLGGEIAEIVQEEEVECVFVLGDLFENFHIEAEESEVISAVQSVLKPILRKVKTLVYITSSSSHDPIVKGAIQSTIDNTTIIVSPTPLKVRVGNITLYLTHGDIAVTNGAVAFVINKVYALLRNEDLHLEKELKTRMNIPSESWLIMGHTHVPGIDYTHKVANAGSWKTSWKWGIQYWKPSSRTYILIKNDKVELRKK